MQPDSSRCLDPEVLAAFVAGNLSGAELDVTMEHLRECEKCRLNVIEAARFDRDDEPVVEPRQRPKWPVWLVAAAAVLAGVAFVTLLWRTRVDAPLRALVSATPLDGRYLEPRLSGGFPWAPLRPIRRDRGSSIEPQQMKLVGVAGEVIEQTANDPSVRAQHAAAVAMLLAGSREEASEKLEQLAAPSSDAKYWNDLAVARCAIALHSDEPAQLARALAAVDTALRHDPSFPEAVFNRALILEHLGLRDQARSAWKHYLKLDSSSAWAREAAEHLKALGEPLAFREELDQQYARLTRDANAATELARRFPQEARVWGESEILDRWARSEIGRQEQDAQAHLRVARTFGNQLMGSHGEGMLQQAVQAIERAPSKQRALLAEAHRELREGQKLFRAGKLADAERLLRQASAKFAAGRSPMTLVARYLAANTVYEQRRVEEARTQLEELMAETPRSLPALSAHLQWQLGLVYGSLGRWGKAIRFLGRSSSEFQALGENNYAMTVREYLAQVLERIGQPRQAWSHHILALQELGKSSSRNLETTTYAIARGAALSGDWLVSRSFVDLQFEGGRHPGDELTHMHALLLRARISGQLGDEASARRDLAAASVAIPGIPEPASRESAEAERLAVLGFLARSPSRAIDELTRAIDYQRADGRRMFLPELLLRRGRAFSGVGDWDRAATDFEDGIRELEQQRDSIESGDQRWGMFGAADELFGEAVSVSLHRNDTAAALNYAERARARELLDAVGLSTVPFARTAIHDALILEYVQLPAKLVIFVIDGDRVRAVVENTASSLIEAEIAQLTKNAMSNNRPEFERIAAELYDQLLGPVADELGSNGPLVVIPDGSLGLVPFAALRDPLGVYLIERRAVMIAPSISVLIQIKSIHPPQHPATSRVLMVAGPVSRDGDAGRLTAEKHEIDAIAAEYAGEFDFATGADVRAAVTQSRGRADVIHFVGHAIAPDGDGAAAALVTSSGASIDEQFDVREIAAMQLPNVRLVVLAACGTARSYGRTGESSISLARAFLVAGVPSVIATLWPIEDKPAAEFFPRLHHHLLRGLSPAEALRATQIEWLRRSDVSPANWAAVQIIGS